MHAHPRGEIICCDICARARADGGIYLDKAHRRLGRQNGGHQPHGARPCANVEDQAPLRGRNARRQKHGVVTRAVAASLQQSQAPIEKSIRRIAAHHRDSHTGGPQRQAGIGARL